MDKSSEKLANGINLTSENGKQATFLLPASPPRFDIDRRRELVDKMERLLSAGPPNTPTTDLEIAINSRVVNWEEIKDGLDTLILQDHGGIGIALQLWDRYGESFHFAPPDMIHQYRYFQKSTFEKLSGDITGIRWKHLPDLQATHNRVNCALLSGQRYFALRQIYNETLTTGFKPFRDMEEATEFVFVRQLHGDRYLVCKSAIAITEIETAIKEKVQLKQSKNRQRGFRKQ
ncbi:MAG: hypothetical protein P0Y53_01485 [Candidatus Pseudobacter hemicellulosilyticus]|uniref:Uncharacterized protein n=1 Tax=Candidatus Pseudobacter hemicellulosilyticus TaxID=3121375 RepID=A0AAJ5WSW2_9BACT|nr:MAG: hypothetical protein P0Y53_01485 [Pseudobacter sp.]